MDGVDAAQNTSFTGRPRSPQRPPKTLPCPPRSMHRFRPRRATWWLRSRPDFPRMGHAAHGAENAQGL